jgi:hypothetical protein
MKRCECGNDSFVPFSVGDGRTARHGWRCLNCSRLQMGDA